MNLPNRGKAYVYHRKLTDYLLSESHPIGKWKSKIFRRLGFSEDNVSVLEKEIISIAKSKNVVQSFLSEFGTKYVIDGELKGPNSDSIRIRTIWIIEKGKKAPRFVTAYPLPRTRRSR